MEGQLFSGADEPNSNDLFFSMKERSSVSVEQSLRKQLGLRKSLQILEHSASPGYRSASPLIKEAGTPKPFLPQSTSKENRNSARIDVSSPFQFQTSFNESSRSPYNQSNASLLQASFSAADKTNNVTNNISLLVENDPEIEECSGLFTEFMKLYCNHPHSSDVFELIEQYEETCRANIRSLVGYINKTDPSRRRSKRMLLLLNQLYQECYTWRLLGSLYRDRILSETMGVDMEMEEVTYFDSAKSEKVIMEHLFDCEAGTRHCQIIVDWLEKNMHDKLQDLLMTENIEYHSQSTYWEHTAHDLHQLKAGSRDPALASNLVREMDPDAPIRQERNLSSLDQQDEEQLLLYMFRYIRAGKLEEAQKLCSNRGHFWRAATLDGWRLWHDPNYFDEMDDELQPAEGNPDRDLWKINCWSMAEQKCLGSHEKAIYAALSGHLNQMLPACNSWEDCLWAYFKVLVDVRVEQEIRNHPRSSRDFLPLPKEYWEQVHSNNLTPQGVINQLRAHPRLEIQKQCKETYRLFQTNIILNEIDELLLEMKARMKEQNNPHLLRFMAHLVLFLQAVGIQTNETICVEVLQSYVQVLIETKQNNLVAIYTARLPPEMQITIYAQFLEGIGDDSRETYLELAEEAGLELKLITKRIVENIRDKDCSGDGIDENDSRKINSIDWLIFDPAQRAEAVKQANAIMRGFLAERKHEAAHSVFAKLPNDTIDVIHKQWRMRAGEKMLPADVDDAIREYLCIRAYLNAHDSFNAWFQHYHNQAPEEPLQHSHQTFKEQIAFDESVKEYQIEFQRWQKTLASHVKGTSDCIYNVLLFPGGWMVDQRTDTSIDDSTRSQQLFLLRQLCIPYLTFLLHSVLQSNNLYKPCLKLAEIIQSKRYKLYETFQKHELQRFLRLIRETSIALLDQGVDPFSFDRNNSYEAN